MSAAEQEEHRAADRWKQRGLENAPLLGRRADAIDALRGVMALWVLFAHLVPWAAIAQGPDSAPSLLRAAFHYLERLFQPAYETHPAVLGFIVLSGYCIHRNGLRPHSPALRAFAIRRVFRIYPVYAVAIAVGLAGYSIAQLVSADKARWLSATEFLASGDVLVKAAGLQAFTPSLFRAAFQGNAPLQTVAVELWLYALYPAVMLWLLPATRRFGEAVLWTICVLTVCAGTLAMQVNGTQFAQWWHNSSLPGFFAFWWIGAKFNDQIFAGLARRLAPAMLFGWLLLSYFLLVSDSPPPIWIELRKVIFAFLIGVLVVACDRPLALPRVLSLLGRAGYSIYALHAPAIYLLLILQLPWWLAACIAIGAGLAVHALVERPVQLYGGRLALNSAAGRL